MCGFQIQETRTHIFFSRPAASLWNFVREALALEWQAPDLSEFLEVQTKHTGRRRRPFWLVFAVITWTQWTVRDKMVIKRVFLQCASDSVFKILAFLRQWYPLCRQRDRDRLDGMIDDLLVAVRQLASHPIR